MYSERDEERMVSPAEYVAMLRRRWWVLALLPLLAAIGTYWYATGPGRSYSAAATLLVTSAGSEYGASSEATKTLTKTYSFLVASPTILTRVIGNLGLPDTVQRLANRVKVRAETDTQIISVAAEYHTPELAATIANTVAEEFIGWLAEQQNSGSRVNLAFRAAPPVEASGFPAWVYALMAALLGLFAATTAVILRERTDTRVRSPRDVAREIDLPVIASIPPTRRNSRVEVIAAPQSQASEAIRSLRTVLQFSTNGRGVGAMAITSPETDAGKSAIAANLAVTFAQAGHRTLLIDGNLRHPSLHELFGLPSQPGLSDVLADPAWQADELMEGSTEIERFVERGSKIERFIVDSPVPRLRLLLAGSCSEGCSELLTGERLKRIISTVRAVADVVIIDTPPLLKASDAMVLVGTADQVIMVADAGRTRPDMLSGATEKIRSTGAKVVGVVLNGAKPVGAAA